MNKTLTYLFLVSLCMAGFTGCIKEDFSDCPLPVDPPVPPVEETDGLLKLQLSYTMHNHKENGTYTDRFDQEVHKADVFVFDQDGMLVLRDTDPATASATTSPYTRTMKLPAGTYQAVVWGNHYEDETTCLTGKEIPLAASHMTLNDAEDGKITYLTDSLFHGMTAQPFTIVAGEEQTVPVDLMKNRKDIRLLVRWHEKERTKVRFVRTPPILTI